MPKLVGHRYGKARVRVLKILRQGKTHWIKDIDVKALLQGDFESSYTSGDNSKVVATDSVKNTINILAKQELGPEIERFALSLGEHFLKKYPQIESTIIDVAEREWTRMNTDGIAQPHAFLGNENSRMIAHMEIGRNKRLLQSGVRDLIIMKSTGSGFEEYVKDEFTTLRPTKDRILATAFSATWTFSSLPADCRESNEKIMSAMLKVFAETFSPSAQTSLFHMGEAGLAACPEISRLEMAMPNKHYLLIDLSPFGLENENEIFLPIDEPHGQIEAIIER
jgi:urate oxidase